MKRFLWLIVGLSGFGASLDAMQIDNNIDSIVSNDSILELALNETYPAASSVTSTKSGIENGDYADHVIGDSDLFIKDDLHREDLRKVMAEFDDDDFDFAEDFEFSSEQIDPDNLAHVESFVNINKRSRIPYDALISMSWTVKRNLYDAINHNPSDLDSASSSGVSDDSALPDSDDEVSSEQIDPDNLAHVESFLNSSYYILIGMSWTGKRNLYDAINHDSAFDYLAFPDSDYEYSSDDDSVPLLLQSRI